MDSGDSIEIENGKDRKSVTLMAVARGRVSVHWPLVGIYDIDLDSGNLVSQPLPLRGIFTVDGTGRVVGTRGSVAPEELPRLDGVQPGDTLRLQHATAVVVDVLPSEGTLKIFIDVDHDARAVVPRSIGWRVSPAMLRTLRERAGLFVAMAG